METYTSGTWMVKAGEEDAFVQAWTEFASWGSEMTGAGTMRLTRDLSQPRRFFSFAPWEDIHVIRAWKSSPEFRERIGRVRQHTEDFTPWELELVTAVQAGARV